MKELCLTQGINQDFQLTLDRTIINVLTPLNGFKQLCISCCLCFANQIFVSYLIFCATTVQEVNYAENCFQNKDEGTVQHGLENNSTQYAAPTPPNYDAHIEEMKAELFDLVKAL